MEEFRLGFGRIGENFDVIYDFIVKFASMNFLHLGLTMSHFLKNSK